MLFCYPALQPVFRVVSEDIIPCFRFLIVFSVVVYPYFSVFCIRLSVACKNIMPETAKFSPTTLLENVIKISFTGYTVVVGRVLWIWVGPSFRLSILLSVVLFLRLSGSFLGFGPLVFFETQHCVKDQCEVVCNRARFFGKKSSLNKNDQKKIKMTQKCFFGTFL